MPDPLERSGAQHPTKSTLTIETAQKYGTKICNISKIEFLEYKCLIIQIV